MLFCKIGCILEEAEKDRRMLQCYLNSQVRDVHRCTYSFLWNGAQFLALQKRELFGQRY
jgi:hypothetical protein